MIKEYVGMESNFAICANFLEKLIEMKKQLMNIIFLERY